MGSQDITTVSAGTRRKVKVAKEETKVKEASPKERTKERKVRRAAVTLSMVRATFATNGDIGSQIAMHSRRSRKSRQELVP